METLQDKIKLFENACNFVQSDRIPTYSNYWTYIILDAGYTLKDGIYNTANTADAVFRFHEKYGFDCYGYFGARNPWNVTEPFDGNHYIVNEAAETINIKDKILMEPEEYDELISDVWKFVWEKAIPRKCPGTLAEDAWDRYKVSLQAQKDYGAFLDGVVGKLLGEYQVPLVAGAWGLIPFEMLFNYFRGIKGVSIDLRRRYDKVVEASKACEDIAEMPAMYAQLEGEQPPIFAHHGAFCLLAHTVVSEKQFNELFWPYIKKAVDICVEKGKRLFLFTEGSIGRFDCFQDIPRGAAVLQPEQDDVFELRKKFPQLAINGGMSSALLGNGTVDECLDYAKKLVEELGPGFVMGQDKMMSFRNDAKPENILAVQQFCKEYYK